MPLNRLIENRQELIAPACITLVFVAFSYIIHQYEGSMLSQTDDIWVKKVAFSLEYYPYSKRYFTDVFLLGAETIFGVKYLTSFIVLQYSLMFTLGMAFYSFLKALNFSAKSSCVGLVILLASYPILGAFIIPVYTWDDFWQYLAIVFTFLLILRNRPIWASVVFAIGALARDPILLFYPIFLYAVFVNNKTSKRNLIITAIIPIVIYGFYSLFTFEIPEDVRFQNFAKNFLDAGRAKNSVFSFMASFGFMWVTFYVALIALGRRLINDAQKNWVLVGAAVMVPLITVITFTMTLARETRIFFPPFIFLIPLTLWVIEEFREQLTWYYRKYYGLLGLATIIAVGWLGIKSARVLFPAFDFRGLLEFTQIYFGIQIALALLFLIPLTFALIRNIFKTSQHFVEPNNE